MRHFVWLSILLIVGCAPNPQGNAADPNAKTDPPVQANKLVARDPSLGMPKTLARPCFTFDHPAGWKVNEKEEEFDPMHGGFWFTSREVTFNEKEEEFNPVSGILTFTPREGIFFDNGE